MQVISNQFFKNLLFRPIFNNGLQRQFQKNEIIHGKIIHSLPEQNVFILHTKGMNLVASTRISLFVGDTIVGKVLNNKEKIELKLSEVNGKTVRQRLSISEDGLNLTRVPLPELIWGKRAFLELYEDTKSNQEEHGSEEQHYYLILSTDRLQNVAMDLQLEKSHLRFNVWIENQDLFRFIKSRSEEIRELLRDENIEHVDFWAMPLCADISYFRRRWTGETNLDIRA